MNECSCSGQSQRVAPGHQSKFAIVRWLCQVSHIYNAIGASYRPIIGVGYFGCTSTIPCEAQTHLNTILVLMCLFQPVPLRFRPSFDSRNPVPRVTALGTADWCSLKGWKG